MVNGAFVCSASRISRVLDLANAERGHLRLTLLAQAVVDLRRYLQPEIESEQCEQAHSEPQRT